MPKSKTQGFLWLRGSPLRLAPRDTQTTYGQGRKAHLLRIKGCGGCGLLRPSRYQVSLSLQGWGLNSPQQCGATGRRGYCLPYIALRVGRTLQRPSLGTGPIEPRKNSQGVSRYRGPQPPNEASGEAWGRLWRPQAKAASTRSTRPVPGLIQFSRPWPRKPIESGKTSSWIQKAQVSVFFFSHIFGAQQPDRLPVFPLFINRYQTDQKDRLYWTSSL